MIQRSACLLCLLTCLAAAALAQDAPRQIVREATGPQRWALLVGVNDYAELEDLKYCGRDMRALAENLKGAGFPEDQIFLLHGEAEDPKNLPLKVNIENQLELILSLAEKDDLVLVAFSGHGMHAEGVTYLCPTEARSGDPKGSMVSLDFVYEKLEKCPAALKLLLADACRNDPRPRGKKTGEPKGDATKLAKQFERPPAGVLVLTSCDEGQVSWEDQELEHGVFTHFLLKGLAGEADGNNNGRVSLGELFEYSNLATKKHVARRWGDYQTPQLFGRLSGVFEFERSGPPLLVSPFSEAEATAARKAWAEHRGVEGSVKNSIGMELVLIPPGEFLMGTADAEIEQALREDTFAEREHFTDEQPQHRVCIAKPFYLGNHEVTQQEYERVMGVNPSWFSSTGDGRDRVSGLDTRRFPVEEVTWLDAVEFCNKLSESEGLAPHYTLASITRLNGRIRQADVSVSGGSGYRLPTEGEWEYACRAGTSTHFHFGRSNDGSLANVDGNHPYGTATKGPYLQRTTTIGSYRANPFGLYDMHGNVSEWCQDWYAKDYYGGAPTYDPPGEATGSSRVYRGGGWGANAKFCRSAIRRRNWPGTWDSELGFRLARTP